jgi:hypothetical protein
MEVVGTNGIYPLDQRAENGKTAVSICMVLGQVSYEGGVPTLTWPQGAEAS